MEKICLQQHIRTTKDESIKNCLSWLVAKITRNMETSKERNVKPIAYRENMLVVNNEIIRFSQHNQIRLKVNNMVKIYYWSLPKNSLQRQRTLGIKHEQSILSCLQYKI